MMRYLLLLTALFILTAKDVISYSSAEVTTVAEDEDTTPPSGDPSDWPNVVRISSVSIQDAL